MHDLHAGPIERKLELQTGGRYFEWNAPKWQLAHLDELHHELDQAVLKAAKRAISGGGYVDQMRPVPVFRQRCCAFQFTIPSSSD